MISLKRTLFRNLEHVEEIHMTKITNDEELLNPDKEKNGKHQEHIKSSIVVKQKYKKSKH